MKLARIAATALGVLLLAGAPAQAKTVVVPRDYPTIQAAVDAAAPGDTVIVGRGTYTEQVVIGKDLDLRGAGVGATVIKAPATLTPYAVNLRNSRSVTTIVRVGRGAHASVSGLTVSGPTPCGLVSAVFAGQAATLDLSDARISDILPGAAGCPDPPGGRAVVFGAPPFVEQDGQRGTTASGRVTHVVIDGYQTDGVVATGPVGGAPTRVTVADNVVTAGAPVFPTDQSGISIDFGAVAQVTENTVSGNVCTVPGCGADPINEIQSAGILVVGVPADTKITDNHVSGADIGVYQLFNTGCCTISQNTLQDNRYFGIVLQDGDGTTSENTITGGQTGIGVVADSVDTTGLLRGDHISGTSAAPVREIQCCGFTATAIVKQG